MDPIFQQTTVNPVLEDRKYRWESGIIPTGLRLPEPTSATYELFRYARALSRGYRSGDSLHLTQTIDFEFQITNPAKIDRDYRYYKSKDYCGTWQVLADGGIVQLNHGGFFQVAEGGSRLINNFVLNVMDDIRPEEYLLQQLQFSGEIKSCNFDLSPSVFPDPNTGFPVAGFSLIPPTNERPNALIEMQNRFLWTNDDLDYPYSTLGNTGTYYNAVNLTNFWYYLGLYVFEGAEITSITETIGVDSLIPIQIPATVFPSIAIPPLCGIPAAACDNLWDIFLQEQSNRYQDQQTCNEASLGFCSPNTWVCPTDSTDTRIYWTPDQI